MIRITFNMAACTEDEDSEHGRISLTVKLNTSFSSKDLKRVLNRVASSEIKPEAEFAAKILALEKECLEPLYCLYFEGRLRVKFQKKAQKIDASYKNINNCIRLGSHSIAFTILLSFREVFKDLSKNY